MLQDDPQASRLTPPPHFTATPPWRRTPWLILLVTGLCLLAYGIWAAGNLGRRQALNDVAATAQANSVLYVDALRSELEKQLSLPFVLAQDTDVRATLDNRADAQTRSTLNRKLDVLSAGTHASVIYLLDRQGMAIAASNWQLPTSFIGNDYSFRPYFRDAVQNGEARYFAMGTVSHQPGLYLTRRVDTSDGWVGVVVVKVDFAPIEMDWRQATGPIFVTDSRGIVLITSLADWRFRTLRSISPDQREAMRRSQQFGDASLEQLPLTPVQPVSALGLVRLDPPASRSPQTFLEIKIPVPQTDWTLHYLVSIDVAADRAAAQLRLTVALALIVALTLIGFILRRWDRAAARTVLETAIRNDLERRVDLRTAELTLANDQLRSEIDNRQRAQTRLQLLQDELVQANKLTILGQITANVAHEINQPVAAIRSYADNSLIFLARQQGADAADNLRLIGQLTERIGTITDELRHFARKPASNVGPVNPAEAIDGALLLVGHRLREQTVDLQRGTLPGHVRVVADRVKLEQILVNLLQNALDAIADRPVPQIKIDLSYSAEAVSIQVIDNGGGLDVTVIDELFTPFMTTKANGLGLGLVISRDIATEFGGGLSAANGADSGAILTISLRRVL